MPQGLGHPVRAVVEEMVVRHRQDVEAGVPEDRGIDRRTQQAELVRSRGAAVGKHGLHVADPEIHPPQELPQRSEERGHLTAVRGLTVAAMQLDIANGGKGDLSGFSHVLGRLPDAR